MEELFPLKPENVDEHLQVINFKDDIDRYYENGGLGMQSAGKPVFKKNKSK